jgi:hypothetical protein
MQLLHLHSHTPQTKESEGLGLPLLDDDNDPLVTDPVCRLRLPDQCRRNDCTSLVDSRVGHCFLMPWYTLSAIAAVS